MAFVSTSFLLIVSVVSEVVLFPHLLRAPPTGRRERERGVGSYTYLKILNDCSMERETNMSLDPVACLAPGVERCEPLLNVSFCSSCREFNVTDAN